ncbi:helix-turn-helix domain-containing protein [Streptomyces sp. PSKA30]|nr:helix-turn-helix domain-containing protein [Streptomyces sp. PSKA30]
MRRSRWPCPEEGVRKIARRIGRDPAVVSREIRRNSSLSLSGVDR